MECAAAGWEIAKVKIRMATPGSKEPGGFVMRVRYTQQSLEKLADGRETRDVKLRRPALSILSVLYLVGAPVGLFARPDEPKQFDPKLFQELRWRLTGPSRGGRALAVAGVRGQPEVFYFGSVGGGVWKTNDAGRTWKPIFDSQPIASIGAIAVANQRSASTFALHHLSSKRLRP